MLQALKENYEPYIYVSDVTKVPFDCFFLTNKSFIMHKYDQGQDNDYFKD